VTVGCLRGGQVSLLFEQHTEIERPERVAALVGATVRLRCGCPLAALLEQHTEIAAGGGVATFVGLAVRLLRGEEVTLLFEQHPDLERGRAVSAVIHAMIALRAGHLSVRFERHAERLSRQLPPGADESLAERRTRDPRSLLLIRDAALHPQIIR
jgi:hypothetical protein